MKIKRLLAFVISVAMIVGMVPTFVFAKELDLEADEPETTEAAEAEGEKEEEEKEEEPAQAEDKEEASDAEDKDADEEDPDLNVPEEANDVVGAAPSQSQDQTVSTSRSAVNGRIGKSKVYWVFSGTVLTVYGKGAMPAWKSEASVPWHRYRSQIKHIYVRSGVTTIGNFAFSNLTNLEGGTIWSYTRGKWKLKSIGNYAFNNTKLGGIPAFKTVSKIGARAFMRSGLVGTITIPKNCKSLGVYAFAENPMTKVALNSKIKSIPNYCFTSCALTGVTIPKQVKSIGQYAFAGNTKLIAVTIGKNVKTIGNGAFEMDTSLEKVTFGKNVSSIGKYAFNYCQKLDNVVLPSKVKAISAYTFDNCTRLKTIKLPGKLKAIGTAAFFNCTSLQSIAIPGTVSSISSGAFASSGLTSVRIPGSVKTIGVGAFDSAKLSSVTLCSGIKTISAGAFYNNVLTSVDIPASVTSIGTEAFGACSKLSNVKLNYGIKTIDDAAFSNTAIKAITLPDSITALGDDIFSGTGTIVVRTTDKVKTLNSNAWKNATVTFRAFAANTMTVSGKTATVKASKVRKKAQKISVSKLYSFSNPGVGTHLFAKSSGNKKITVSGNGVITVKKGLKKGTYTVKVKVMATGDQTTANTSWQIVTVKVKVK